MLVGEIALGCVAMASLEFGVRSPSRCPHMATYMCALDWDRGWVQKRPLGPHSRTEPGGKWRRFMFVALNEDRCGPLLGPCFCSAATA